MTAWAEYLVELHRVKDIAYGDAWCRRGEAVGIFPNIARKYDRWERLRLDRGASSEGAVEPLDDTLADLLIYAVKYVRWLRDRDPETAQALPASIQARSEVADLIVLVTELPAVESPDEELDSAFRILESTFKAEANVDPAERAGAAWMLARSAWSELRSLPVSTEAKHGTASVLTSEATRTADDLEDQLLTAFSASPGRILLLGVTPTAIRLNARLSDLHLGQWVVGIAEPGRPQNAEVGTIDWAKAAAEPISYLVVTDDAGKEDLLRGYVSTSQWTEQLPKVILSGTAHLEFRDALYTELDAPALVPSYATGYQYTRVHIFQYLRAAAQSGLTGAIVEFGAFKGGTTAWLARTAKRLGLAGPVMAFDSWDGFPPRRSILDMYTHPRCVFGDIEAVRSYLKPLGVEMVPGDISETAVPRLRGLPILLAFIDTDNYSPAAAALSAVITNLIPGGAVVFDHYTTTEDYVYTLGERMAANEVLAAGNCLAVHGTGLFVKLPTGDHH